MKRAVSALPSCLWLRAPLGTSGRKAKGRRHGRSDLLRSRFEHGSQRSLELEADILLKATRVDGVYSEDPEKNPHAVLYSDLTYQSVIEQNLRVMDSTAITLCMEHHVPILVFNYRKDGNIQKAVSGEKVGTLIQAGET